jgi:toxin ParE1/3/4
LRFWGCKRFPYLVFYFESKDQIDVWRVLHDGRDIPAWLRDEAGHEK